MIQSKNKLFDRVLALVLTVLMVVALIPADVFAVEGPTYGTVSTYTGGTVKNDGTANVEVVVEETTLEWVPANSLRAEGWWVGIRATAPEGFSADATYKSKNNPSGEYGAVKKFADYKDGDNYIQLWFPVSPDSLKNFTNAKRNLTLMYAFDWNADNDYEQEIVFSVVPSEKIVLMKDGVQEYPKPAKYGTVSTYTGGTVKNDASANVEVTVEETTLEWVPATEARAEGWWVGIRANAPEGFSADATFKVKKDSDGEYSAPNKFEKYKDGDDYIQLWFSVSPDSLKEAAEAKRNITKTYAFDWNDDAVYEQKIVFSVVPSEKIVLMKDDEQIYPIPTFTLSATKDTGGTILLDGEALESKKVQKDKSVEVQVKADEGYVIKSLMIDGTEVVDAVNQKEHTVNVPVTANVEVNASFVQIWTVSVTKTTGGNVSLDDSNVDAKEVISGNTTAVKVKADEGYRIASLTIGGNEIADAANKSEYTVNVPVTKNVEINASFVKFWTVEVTSEGNGQVTVDPATEGGSVTVAEASTVKITATPAEGCKVASVTINDIADQEFVSENDKGYSKTLEVDKEYTVKIVFSENMYDVTVNDPENGSLNVDSESVAYDGSTKVTLSPNEGYTVDSIMVNEEPITSVTKDSTSIYFNIGNITEHKHVVVTYKETSKALESDLKVEGIVGSNPKDNLWILDQGKNPATTLDLSTEKSGIRVYAKYNDNNVVIGNLTTQLLSIDNEMTIIKVQLYYQADDEMYPDWHTVDMEEKQVVIDATAPSYLAVSYKAQDGETDNEISPVQVQGKNYFYDKPLQVTIKASDDVALDRLVYSYIEGKETTVQVNGKEEEYTFKLPDKFKGKIKFTAIDKTGKETSYIDDKIIVVDLDNPEISVDWKHVTGNQDSIEGGIRDKYFNQDIKAVIKITDANFYAQDVNVTVIKTSNDENAVPESETKTLSFRKNDENENEYIAEITFDEDADYSLNIQYTDRSGNESETYDSGKFTIDKIQPEIFIKKVQGEYFDDDREVTITVKEHNFDVGKIDEKYKFNFMVNANYYDKKDDASNDKEYELKNVNLSENYLDFLNVKKNWNKVAHDKWETKITFDKPGNYTIEASYTDLAGNSQKDEFKDTFSIDKAKPKELAITYDKSVTDLILENITFGFYQAPLMVKIEAIDNVSGIEKFVYSYPGVDNIEVSGEAIHRKDNKAWTTFTLPENFRGTIEFTAIDKAGNSSSIKDKHKVNDDKVNDKVVVVDNVAPEIDVTFDNNDVKNGSYYNGNRTATIKIKEANFFEQDLDGKDKLLKIQVKKTLIGGKTTTETMTPKFTKSQDEEDCYVAKIEFKEEANYELNIQYTDRSGNKAEEYKSGEFTVDKSKPKMDIMINKESVKVKDMNTVVYDKFYPSAIKIDLPANCDISGLNSLKYQIVVNALDYEDDAWIDYNSKTGVVVKPNERFVIYARAEDKAGNVTVVRSTGIVVDNKLPIGEVNAPKIDILPAQPNENGFYNGNVKVDLKVVDPKYDGSKESEDGHYSGLNKVTYEIIAKDIDVVETGTLLDRLSKKKGAVIDENNLISSWSGNITINSKKFNSNNVVVKVTAVDNAGNTRVTKTEKGNIKVDITKPKIDITYDNNAVDSDRFFKADRTATVVVTERNFDPKDVITTITNTDGKAPTISKFKKEKGNGNGDDTTWTATIKYAKDGDYTFDIEYTDLADNKCKGANYGDSVAPKKFTIDKTTPVVSVSYNNNNAKNGKYFSEPRTATIVIKEHNFNVDRVIFTQKASLNGANITIPSATWKHNGDTHTATIAFTKDGDYTFDVAVNDKAGNENKNANYGNSVAAKDFVVDQKVDKPTIGGVVDGGAYKGDVIPTISFADVNYADYDVTLKRTRLGKKNVNVKDKFIKDKDFDKDSQGRSGTFDTFEKVVENDGIYKLTVTVVDKAGNESTEEVTFSVNRFGSVYEYSDYLVSLIEDGGKYVTKSSDGAKAIDKDIVITEYNPDKLVKDSLKIIVTRDGQAINVDYTSNPVQINENAKIGDKGWYEYVYTIKSSNFEEDGVYKISLASAYETVDSKDPIDSTSVPENSQNRIGEHVVGTIGFTVDTTAPQIRNIVNLDKEIVNAPNLDVTYTIVDVGGIKSIEVIVNGKTVDKIDKFKDNNFNYSGTFTIDESSEVQTVQLKVVDLAGNVTDTAAKNFKTNDLYEFHDKVTVSTNFFVRWYANKPLFWSSIIGIIALIVAIFFFIVGKRKKQEEESE